VKDFILRSSGQSEALVKPKLAGLEASVKGGIVRRGGAQAEALAAFRRLRDRLNDELGLEPGMVADAVVERYR